SDRSRDAELSDRTEALFEPSSGSIDPLVDLTKPSGVADSDNRNTPSSQSLRLSNSGQSPAQKEGRGPGHLFVERETGMRTILFLAANPADTDRVRLDMEMREIDAKLQSAEFRQQFELRSHWAVSTDDLQSALLRHRPCVVHFSGHGTSFGEIIVEGSMGQS